MDGTKGIVCSGVSKGFLRQDGSLLTAVDNADFSVFPGEVFGILGPNGAGKTTTLRMISTVLSPDSGTITVNGFDTVKEPENVRRSLGFLSGNTGLYKRLTAREMVGYFGRLFGMPEDVLKRRTDELFAMLSLEPYSNELCEKLSTGNRQKVSIARSIVHDPPIMVFDEPTTGLDVIIAEGLMDFIRSLSEKGRTVIFSTHVMEEAERLCDRIAFIHDGKIIAIGTLTELIQRQKQHPVRMLKTCVRLSSALQGQQRAKKILKTEA